MPGTLTQTPMKVVILGPVYGIGLRPSACSIPQKVAQRAITLRSTAESPSGRHGPRGARCPRPSRRQRCAKEPSTEAAGDQPCSPNAHPAKSV